MKTFLRDNGLTIALTAMFLISMIGMVWSGFIAHNDELREHGATAIESFQNWQSEFMSTAVLVVLSIFLRHKGSPESKPASAPNSTTGA